MMLRFLAGLVFPDSMVPGSWGTGYGPKLWPSVLLVDLCLTVQGFEKQSSSGMPGCLPFVGDHQQDLDSTDGRPAREPRGCGDYWCDRDTELAGLGDETFLEGPSALPVACDT